MPTINFQTGPQEYYYATYYYYPYITGGYIYTSDCFLPEDVRPTDLVYRSIVGASNNGLSLPWDFNDLSSLPVPPVGYIVQVTNAGALVIQCARNRFMLDAGAKTLDTVGEYRLVSVQDQEWRTDQGAENGLPIDKGGIRNSSLTRSTKKLRRRSMK